MTGLRRRLILVIAISVTVLVIGTSWYTLVEKWTLLDSLYMTVITLTTVGYGEVQPLSRASRLFTIVLILLGVGTVAYSLSTLGEYFLTAGVVERIRERGLMRVINNLQNHIIICGAGRVGRTAGETLREVRRDFIIVDIDAEVVNELTNEGWLAIVGDATRDEALYAAGIERAAGILVCTGNDSNNLFIVLSARSINPNLLIVARSVESANENKMRRAGADKVISPYQIGGRHMANVVVRPHVAEFLDVVTLDSDLELWLEEVAIGEESPLADKTVVEADIRRKTGVIMVALLRGEERIMFTPDEKTYFAPGDRLIVLGTREQLKALENLVANQVMQTVKE